MKNRTLVFVAIIIVATTLLGNSVMHYIGIQNTADIQTGMDFSQYAALIPEEERLDFWNYSFFLNDFNYPVLLRCEDEKIVQIQVIDTSAINIDQESFEKITQGMTLSEVSRRVGVPGGITKDDDRTLAYSVRNETMYLIRYTLKDGVQYVESIKTVDLQQDS